jgi:hypothetical protein
VFRVSFPVFAGKRRLENMCDTNGDAEDAGFRLSPITPYDWWPPLEPHHENYHRFFDIDPYRGQAFIDWLEERVPIQPDHTRSTFVRQGIVAVSSSLGNSRTTFVFSDGILELFRKFVNETDEHDGLVFKRWQVPAGYVRDLLNKSEVQLENMQADHQFFDAVFGEGFF